MEQILDVTLKNDIYNHSDDEVDLFYQTFKSHQEAYKAIDEDVMDLLFGLVDFSKFKNSVLEYKRGCINKDAGEVDEENKHLITGKQGFEFEEFLKEFEVNPDDKSNSWVRKITQKDFKKGLMINMWQRKNEIKGAPDWLRLDMSM